MKKLPYVWIRHRVDTPVWIAKHIGKIAIEWSDLEWQFEDTIRLLMDAPVGHGRIATTGMTMRSRVVTTTNFVKSHVYHQNLPPAFSTQIEEIARKFSGKLETDRNKFVHGLYGKWRGKWYLLRNSGTRRVPDLKEIGKFPRAVLPQREEITPTIFEASLSDITQMRQRMVKFCEDLEAALPPSQHKSPRHIRQHSFPPARRKRAPSRQPRSSRR